MCLHPLIDIELFRSVKPPPLIVVESSSEDVAANAVAKYEVSTDVLPNGGAGNLSPATSTKILGTRWHDYSDDAMRAAVSELASSSHDIPIDHPCYPIIRALSSTVYNLTRARQELEESRRELMEKEAARKARGKQLLQELQPSEKDVANRVLQSLFPNDDETTHQVHRVQRQQSVLVSMRNSWAYQDASHIIAVSCRVSH